MNSNENCRMHVQGRARFVDDFPLQQGTLFAALCSSPHAHARIVNTDISSARRHPGVVDIFTANDVPGQLNIGNIIQDEPLLAEQVVNYIGEPVALIIADSARHARQAAALVRIEYEELQEITDPREAYAQGRLIVPPRTFCLGDTERIWEQCPVIVEDRVDSGHQEHLYLEMQCSYAWPVDHDRLHIISSTQAPSAVQKMVSRMLKLPMHRIEVEVPRLGGAFGGKEEQATHWACLSALAAWLLQKPVKLCLNRKEDMNMTGKRHAYSADFKLGLNRDGRILAYEAFLYQNAGACADLSPSILERSLFHATNSYYIPNVMVTAVSCRTNLPPNTAFRGFGGPQAMFVIESALDKAARRLGMDRTRLQEINLLRPKSIFPYGMQFQGDAARQCWKEALSHFDYSQMYRQTAAYNKQHTWSKKGLAVMPVCFGISFTSKFLNQASALVHIYNDGSVSINTAAVEMGQGVHEKMKNIAARVLSVNPSRISVEYTNTSRVANTSPTAASTGSDLNGQALKIACKMILQNIKQWLLGKYQLTDPEKITIREEQVTVGGKVEKLNWQELINAAYMDRVDLSAHAFYATPGLEFDRKTEKGKPFAYHVNGTAIIQVSVDRLRGTYSIDQIKIVHDLGESLHPQIDLGQVEGGVMQGLGWMTMEELIYSDKGRNVSDSLSTYKIPDIQFGPGQMDVKFVQTGEPDSRLFHSKAVGEPPLMYGIGVYFALLNAVRACNDMAETVYSAPFTPEKVLMMLLSGQKRTKEDVTEPTTVSRQTI